MFLTTLLSALPLLNPALPVQEPVTKTGQKSSCSSQEPVAKSNTTRTKTGKIARNNTSKTKRIYGKTTVNRSVVNTQIAGTTTQEPANTGKTNKGKVNSTKKRSQNALRRVTRTATAPTTANTAFDVSGLSTVKTKGSPAAQIGTGKVRIGIEKARNNVNALNFIDTGIPQNDGVMWTVDNTTGNSSSWGTQIPTPVDSLANAGKTTKTKKPAKKQKANKQVRKNRKR